MSISKGAKFIVQGGNPISGEIEPQGNKNEAMPLMAAACLTGQPVILQNIPQIDDVRLMEKILNDLGLSRVRRLLHPPHADSSGQRRTQIDNPF
jgi:UDP-N-acetylglucosamine enolpyruvyl transferase